MPASGVAKDIMARRADLYVRVGLGVDVTILLPNVCACTPATHGTMMFMSVYIAVLQR